MIDFEIMKGFIHFPQSRAWFKISKIESFLVLQYDPSGFQPMGFHIEIQYSTMTYHLSDQLESEELANEEIRKIIREISCQG